MADGPRRPRLGLRARILGGYLVLVGLALVLITVVTFRQADRAQREAVDIELREEVRDFGAGLQAGRNDGLTVDEAIDSYTDSWPEDDRDSIVVLVGEEPVRGAGPLARFPVMSDLAREATSPRLINLRVEGNELRAFATPLLLDGRRIGGTVVARFTQEERDALFERRLAVLLVGGLAFLLASVIAWFTLGRLLRPVKQIAATADGIARSGDLSRRIDVGARNDEAGVLGTTFNRMLERLEGSFRREQRFIREASHELRTPITICRGHLEVLGSDPSPKEIEEAHEVVVDELARMGRIVEDMATLARAEDPGFIQLQEVPVERFLGEVARAAEPLLDGRLKLEQPPSGGLIRLDPQRMQQALLNLLQNAALHAPVETEVVLGAAESGFGWRLSVADRGGGVPAGEEEKLFRPFARGASRAPGSGLGLAIVRGIAEAHGGRAGCDNRPGVGATFWVTVPR
ncbi:MAG: HAMP domain-containing sensor histidine kinase [Miltoncostaeaceae bacterium]